MASDNNDLVTELGRRLNSRGVAHLAAGLDLDADDARKVVEVGLPILLERLQANSRSGGADDLAGAINRDHDGSVLESSAFLRGGFKSGPGMAILGHVFGDEIDGVVKNISGTTGVPAPAVNLALSALAPLALGGMAKVAIGAVTAVVAIKLLDIAVDKSRDGTLQRMVGSVDDYLDRDGDGSSLDDVGRGAVTVASTAATQTKRAVTSKRAKRLARSAGRNGSRAAKKAGSVIKANGPKLAKSAAGATKKRLGRFFRR